EHAQTYYRHPDGTPTSELADYKLSLRPLRQLFGHTPARDFDAPALEAVREQMIGAGLCRGVINQRIRRLQRMFRWAASKKLVPVALYQEICTLEPLQRGRSRARETEPVEPVADAVVQATLPFLLPPVAAMVQLQSHSGMRPGEVVILRGIDLDTTGKVWL